MEEVVVVYLKFLFQHLPEGINENCEKPEYSSLQAENHTHNLLNTKQEC
jgi:hypothetical protein